MRTEGDALSTMMVSIFASRVCPDPFKAGPHRVQRLRDHVRRGIDYAKYMLIAACSCAVLAPVHHQQYVFKPDAESSRSWTRASWTPMSARSS